MQLEVGEVKAEKGRIGKIAELTGKIKGFIQENPGVDEETIMKAININRNTFYNILIGLSGDPDLCQKGIFRIKKGGRRLAVEQVERWLKERHEKGAGGYPKQPERLLYLYHHLHRAIPDGGLTLKQLEDYYLDLIERSGSQPTSPEALKRMLYRDLKALEEINITFDRPYTGSKKYCLRANYLPKLAPESAAAVYVSMLLFQNTVLDQALSGARFELERAFFKRSAWDPKLLQDRIHIVGDTLANPEQFGGQFGKLVRSVAESHPIRITYIKINREISDRVLEPVGMVCKRGVWYVIARLPENHEYRTFRVDQIEHIYVREGEVFHYPEDFDVGAYLGSSWGVFKNDEVQKVYLRFTPDVAPRVKSLRYHCTQELVEEEADGSVIIGFEVCGLIELRSWILQWGTQVEVLKPEELRVQVTEMAQKVYNLYQKADSKVPVHL